MARALQPAVTCCRGNSESLVVLVSGRCGHAEIVNSRPSELARVLVRGLFSPACGRPPEAVFVEACSSQTAAITASCKVRRDRCQLRCSFLLLLLCNCQAPGSPKWLT